MFERKIYSKGIIASSQDNLEENIEENGNSDKEESEIDNKVDENSFEQEEETEIPEEEIQKITPKSSTVQPIPGLVMSKNQDKKLKLKIRKNLEKKTDDSLEYHPLFKTTKDNNDPNRSAT